MKIGSLYKFRKDTIREFFVSDPLDTSREAVDICRLKRYNKNDLFLLVEKITIEPSPSYLLCRIRYIFLDRDGTRVWNGFVAETNLKEYFIEVNKGQIHK